MHAAPVQRQMRIQNRDAFPGTETELLANPPELDAAMTMAIECWHDLDSCRAERFSGRGSIPYTALLSWAEFKQLDHELTTILISVIRRLDHERAEREASKRSLGG